MINGQEFRYLPMHLFLEVVKRTFEFSFDAITSRGSMSNRSCWFLILRNKGGIKGIGEVAPLFGLSKETPEQVEADLTRLARWIENLNIEILSAELKQLNTELADLKLCSSVRFGIEMAILDFVHGGVKTIFNSSFRNGHPIPINGLVWMADVATMKSQAESKILEGFKCIKIKVGSLDFDVEVRLIESIRKQYPVMDLQIRLDANGAFDASEALTRLHTLSAFGIHSIEQPVAAGKFSVLADLCDKSPVPIALDEELIGKDQDDKHEFLKQIKPAYIVLKPSLHGGFFETTEWIKTAESLGIGWWITSALETAYGLNAIAQFTALYSPQIPQGLGTGQIFKNGPQSPLMTENGALLYQSNINW